MPILPQDARPVGAMLVIRAGSLIKDAHATNGPLKNAVERAQQFILRERGWTYDPQAKTFLFEGRVATKDACSCGIGQWLDENGQNRWCVHRAAAWLCDVLMAAGVTPIPKPSSQSGS